MEEKNDQDKAEIYSQRVRAGKRTYFFDIKSTRSNDYYLTITESKRRFKDEGFFYEKHKIFLYKEDFDKFIKALQESVEHVKSELLPEVDFSQFEPKDEEEEENQKPEKKKGNSDLDDVDTDSLPGSDDLKWE